VDFPGEEQAIVEWVGEMWMELDGGGTPDEILDETGREAALDYVRASLPLLEIALLNALPDVDALDEIDDLDDAGGLEAVDGADDPGGESGADPASDYEGLEYLVDWSARFIGETFVAAFEASWHYGTGEYAGMPVVVPVRSIEQGEAAEIQVSPFGLIRAAVDVRTGEELTQVFDTVAAFWPPRTTELIDMGERYIDWR
jgi:hypothetical protein